MILRRVLLVFTVTSIAASCFMLGIFHARSNDALNRETYDAKLDAIRAEVRSELGRNARAEAVPAGTSAHPDSHAPADVAGGAAARAKIVTQIKQELQTEMGLLPVHLLRERRSSF